MGITWNLATESAANQVVGPEKPILLGEEIREEFNKYILRSNVLEIQIPIITTVTVYVASLGFIGILHVLDEHRKSRR